MKLLGLILILILDNIVLGFAVFEVIDHRIVDWIDECPSQLKSYGVPLLILTFWPILLGFFLVEYIWTCLRRKWLFT